VGEAVYDMRSEGCEKCYCFIVDGTIGILTFIIVVLDSGTNFPAVIVNPLLAVAMMKTRQL
jgi:hypothetical protein